QSTNGRTLINSFLEARAGEERGQVAGGEAISSPDGVDRSDRERSGLNGLPVGGPPAGTVRAELDHDFLHASLKVALSNVLGLARSGQQPSFRYAWHHHGGAG